MSRTHKDIPLKVRRLNAMKAGRIDHDHRHKNGYHREGYSYFRGGFTVEFLKKDTKKINEYRSYLKTFYPLYDFTEEEQDYEVNISLYPYPLRKIKPRTIAFRVVKLFSYDRTAYCTDAEHYDLETNKDTRDNKAVSCMPELTQEDYGNVYGGKRFFKAEYSQKRVKDNLNSYVKKFNSGVELEELYDDDDISYNQYSSKSTAYYD